MKLTKESIILSVIIILALATAIKHNPTLVVISLLAYLLIHKYIESLSSKTDVDTRLKEIETKVSHLSTKDTLSELTRKK